MPKKEPKKRKVKSNLESVIQLVKDLSQDEKLKVGNVLLEHLFNAVTEESFMQIKYTDVKKRKGVIIIGGKELSKEESQNLIHEAKGMIKFNVYKKAIESMTWTANEMIFKKSTSSDDIIFPKAVLYALDTISKKIDNISKLE